MSSKKGTVRRTDQKSRMLLPMVAALLVVVVVCAFVFGRMLSGRLTVEEAQAQMDAVIESVFSEEASGNYMADLLKPAVDVQVNDIRRSGGGYVADCTVTSLDLEAAIVELLAELTNGSCTYSEAAALVQEKLSAAEEMQQDFQVEFLRVEKAYQPRVPESMVVFCNGNIQNVLPQLYEIMLEESNG